MGNPRGPRAQEHHPQPEGTWGNHCSAHCTSCSSLLYERGAAASTRELLLWAVSPSNLPFSFSLVSVLPALQLLSFCALTACFVTPV